MEYYSLIIVEKIGHLEISENSISLFVALFGGVYVRIN
jgi:hypothetical protein